MSQVEEEKELEEGGNGGGGGEGERGAGGCHEVWIEEGHHENTCIAEQAS